MSWLHLHGKRERADGEIEEFEENVEVTGAIRVQGYTASGFQSYELHPDGLYSIEVSDEAPVEPVAAAKARASSKKDDS
jgi:hypothetical protein